MCSAHHEKVLVVKLYGVYRDKAPRHKFIDARVFPRVDPRKTQLNFNVQNSG